MIIVGKYFDSELYERLVVGKFGIGQRLEEIT